MNADELAARRLRKALKRVDADCAESIADHLEFLVYVDRTARDILASRRAHPSNSRPYDREAEA